MNIFTRKMLWNTYECLSNQPEVVLKMLNMNVLLKI